MKSKKQWFRRALSLVLSLGVALGLFCTHTLAAGGAPSGGSYVMLHPSTGTTPTGVKVSIGDVIGSGSESGTVYKISGNDIYVDLGYYTVNNNSFRLPYPQDIWYGVTMNYAPTTYVVFTGLSNNRTPGSSTQCANSGNQAYYYNLKADPDNKPAEGSKPTVPDPDKPKTNHWVNYTLVYAKGSSLVNGNVYSYQADYTCTKTSASHTSHEIRGTAIKAAADEMAKHCGQEYEIKGWATSTSSNYLNIPNTDYSYSRTQSVKQTGSTIYIIAKPKPPAPTYTYKVTYHANAGNAAVENMPMDWSMTVKDTSVEYTIPETIPTRKGFTFQGWATSASGAVEYRAGDSYDITLTSAKPTKDLYAVWNPIPYTIIYKDGKGQAAFPDDVHPNQTYGDTTPGFEGGQNGKPADYTDGDGVTWTFTGWSPDVKPTVDGDQTYVAQWRALKDPTIDDIGIDKSAEKDAYVVDDTVKYTIKVTNAGEKDAVVTVTDKLPAALAYEKSEPEGKADGQTITWSGLTVPAAKDGRPGERILTVYAKVKTPGDAIKNEAIVALGNDSKKDDADIKASQNETTSSSKPNDTTKPAGPDDTTKPDGPDDTTKPDGPDDTTKPAGPDDTTKPDGPDDTTKPDGPTEPTNPNGPTQPTNPNGPTQPTNPNGPTQPTNPGGQTEPTNPGGQTQPSNPEDEDLEDPDIPLGSRPGPGDGKDSNQAQLPSKPEEDEEIEDPDVPLSDAPKTGENGTKLPLAAAVVGAAGVTVGALALKKKRDEDTAS